MTALSLDRPRTTATTPRRARWHRWANLVVLGYLLLAAVAVPARSVLPLPMWLVVHLLLLGAVTNAILIWSQHFAAALLRAAEPSLRLRATRLATLNAAVVAVLVGVPTGAAEVTIVGATGVAAAVVWHLVDIVRLMRGALQGRFAGTVRYYLASGLALLVGVSLGVTMTTTAARADAVRAAHVHANLLGWVGLAVLGTLFTLWPTVLRTPMVPGVEVASRRCFAATGLGLVTTVGGFLVGWRWVAVVGLLAYLAGVVVALRPFVTTLRQRRPRSFAALSIAAAVGWFALALLGDLVTLTLSASLEDYLARLPEVLPAVLVGFVAQVLMGALSYLLPVMRGGGPSSVRGANAAVDTSALPRLLILNAAAALLAVAPLAAGAGRALTVVAAVLLVVAAAWFVALAGGRVLLRQRDHETAPPGTPQPRHAARLGVMLGLAMTIVPVAVALSGGGSSAPTTVAVSGGGTRTVAVTLANMTISPKRIVVAPGTHLRLVVTNRDAMRHDLAFGRRQTPLLSQGQRATLDLGSLSRSVDGWCTVPGHRAAGMTMSIRMTGAAPVGTVTATAAGTSAGIDVHGMPGAAWRPRDAALAPASGATLHRLTMTVTDKVVDVAPGRTQRMWTFNGTVPGPVLRGHVGDVFEVTLVNRGSMDHGIDFHAGSVAPDDVMRTIAPGESLVYRFRADHAGAWLYHCSAMPMSQHIANGMYGAVIIDPPGLAPADREYALVSAEEYLGPQGGVADPAKLRRDSWDAAVFNGYPDQYVHAPLAAKAGERVRFWVVAAGPNDGLDFHVVGAQFDTVYKEGAYLLRPGGGGAAQVLDFGAAQGGFVEAVFAQPGHYALVDHDLQRGEAGARGILEVTR